MLISKTIPKINLSLDTCSFEDYYCSISNVFQNSFKNIRVICLKTLLGLSVTPSDMSQICSLIIQMVQVKKRFSDHPILVHCR